MKLKTVQCTALKQKDKATFANLACHSANLFLSFIKNIKVLKFVLKMPLIMQISESVNMEFYQQKKVTGVKIFLLRKVSQSSAAERARQ